MSNEPLSLPAPDQEPVPLLGTSNLAGRVAVGNTMQNSLTSTSGKEIEDWGGYAVDDEFGGKMFPYLSNLDKGSQRFYSEAITPQMQLVMMQVGLQFHRDDAGNLTEVFAPDPERLLSVARKNGVPIALEAEAAGRHGRISEERYGEVIASRNHPVGTNKYYYGHDALTIDHIPAVIVLKQKLFDIFEKGTARDRSSAHVYDIFTSKITNAIEAKIAGDKEQYQEFVSQVCPGILNGWEKGNAIDDGVSTVLDMAINEGLENLGIATE